MKKTFKAITISTSFSIQIALFLISLLIIFALSYILGHQYLRGNSLMGNDTFSFFTIAFWIEKYFPYVPYWFPLQGGGISFSGYPWFAAYLVNIIAYLTPLNLVQSFRILGFLSVPLTAVGIFTFCWVRLTEIKPVWMRQVIGLIASVFYVVAPVSWIWLMQWGFYAEHISIIFVPWILLFFDLYLESLFSNKRDFIYRFSILGTVALLLLGFLTHFFVLVTSITVFIILGFARFTFNKENKIALLRKLFIPVIIFLFLLIGLLGFRYYSYIHYVNSVNGGGLGGAAKVADNREGTADSLLTLKMMLSLDDGKSEKINKPRQLIKDMRFPYYVWILLLPTLLVGIFKSRKVFVFSVISVIGLIVNTNIDAYILFSDFPILNRLPLINQLPTSFLGRLFFVQGRVLIPIAAAYGAYVVWELVGLLILRLTEKLKLLYYVLLPVKIFTVLLLTVFTTGIVFIKYYNSPYSIDRINAGYLSLQTHDIWGRMARPEAIFTQKYTLEEKNFLSTHPEYVSIADYKYLKYLCAFDGPAKATLNIYPQGHICSYYPNPDAKLFAPVSALVNTQRECSELPMVAQKGSKKYCLAFYNINSFDQLNLKNWPTFNISREIKDETEGVSAFFKNLPIDSEYRYDISGFSARTIMSTPLVNNNSQIQVYINNLSLLYNLWNFQSQVMYSVFPLYQTPGVLTEIGKWFGIEYVYLSGTPLEPHEYWNTDINWEKVPSVSNSIESKEENINEGWRSFNLATGLTTWDTRPKVLVISNNSKFFYDESFRFFTRGALLYTDAIPVMGKNAIDYYSYDELKEYEAVFMRGYDYRLKWNAYRLLDRYVKNGGKLIFDTGWQYYVPDYQIDKAPAFMPFDNLTWENLSVDSVFKVEDTIIAKDVDVSKIGDLKYENGAWGVSVPGRIRVWGNTVLSYDDKPLVVAGEYGKGKVIWIGFNIIPHQMAKESSDELLLFRNLIQYALSDLPKSRDYQLQMNRITPDKIELTLRDSYSGLSNIYFREAYFPDWSARLVSENKSTRIKVTRAGPGFMLLQLPAVKSGDKVVLEIEPSIKQKMMNMLAILTFLGLLLYLIKPGIYKGIYIKVRNIKIPILIKINPFSKIFSHTRGKILHASKWDSDENDY